MLAAMRQQFSLRQTFSPGVVTTYQHLVNMLKMSYLHVKVLSLSVAHNGVQYLEK